METTKTAYVKSTTEGISSIYRKCLQQHQVQHMAQNHEVLEDINKQIYQQKIAYNDLKSLNQDRKATDNLILYLNIRGLKTNFE